MRKGTVPGIPFHHLEISWPMGGWNSNIYSIQVTSPQRSTCACWFNWEMGRKWNLQLCLSKYLLKPLGLEEGEQKDPIFTRIIPWESMIYKGWGNSSGRWIPKSTWASEETPFTSSHIGSRCAPEKGFGMQRWVYFEVNKVSASRTLNMLRGF